MIEVGDVTAFIDDVMVGIETKKEYDDIVEEVLRKMAENDLFVKLEKYMQKVRKVRFFKVMIGPNGVKRRRKKFKEQWIGQYQQV